MSLHEFAKEEKQRLVKFVTWYEAMSKLEPDKLPIILPDENEAVWIEMLMDFDPSSPEYQFSITEE
tara:strand:+ start:12031 stop:12228 length:198 start_codon:yes stop_codon:yes gene_type:complete